MVHPIDILNAGVPVDIKWLLEQVRKTVFRRKHAAVCQGQLNTVLNCIALYESSTYKTVVWVNLLWSLFSHFLSYIRYFLSII